MTLLPQGEHGQDSGIAYSGLRSKRGLTAFDNHENVGIKGDEVSISSV